MKHYLPILALILISACSQKKNTLESSSIETALDSNTQRSLFSLLLQLKPVSGSINRKDSLAFMIIPLQASCPSCLQKAIDSFVVNQHSIPLGRYVIITANGGKKRMKNYFREYGQELPDIKYGLILDSTNFTITNDLQENNPTFFYVANEMVFKKIASEPATIKQDLHEFFTGTRNSKK